jgi:hypothetical protein
MLAGIPWRSGVGSFRWRSWSALDLRLGLRDRLAALAVELVQARVDGIVSVGFQADQVIE